MTTTKKIADPHMNVQKFCDRMGVSYTVWGNLVSKGEAPPHFKIGAMTKIPVASFERWLQAKIIHPKVEI